MAFESSFKMNPLVVLDDANVFPTSYLIFLEKVDFNYEEVEQEMNH